MLLHRRLLLVIGCNDIPVTIGRCCVCAETKLYMKCSQQTRAGSFVSRDHTKGEAEFRKLKLIRGTNPLVPEKEKFTRLIDLKHIPDPRWKRMPIDQDWPSVYPVAHSFKESAVPLPIRMGYRKYWWRDPPPPKKANLELMKIPNFLHLTPPAIQRHCDAIKKFCTKWPDGLDTDKDMDNHFPIRFTYDEYCHAGPSIRDPRARIVKLKVKVSSLPLNYHAKDKFLRLVGDRYDPETDVVTITCDRCPIRRQNKDYAVFLLTALFFESWKVESWEDLKEKADMENHFWEGSAGQQRMVNIFNKMQEAYKSQLNQEALESATAASKSKDMSRFPRSIRMRDPDGDGTSLSVDDHEDAQKFRSAWDEIRNRNQGAESIEKYGEALRDLLSVPRLKAAR